MSRVFAPQGQVLADLRREIKDRRELKLIDQRKMAKYLDMSQANYSKMEHGYIPMTLTNLFRIAYKLEIAPSELFKKAEKY